jgi:MFS family permease
MSCVAPSTVGSATSSNASAAQATALLIGAAVAGFDAGAIGYVLPAVRTDIGADPQQAAWLVSLYALGTLVAIPVAGARVRGCEGAKVFRGCAAISIAGALLALLSQDITWLLAARLLQGIGQGPLLPVAAAIVAVGWPVERQGRLMGAISLAYGAAFLAGMTLTPLLLLAGWRVVFGLIGLLACAAVVSPVPRATASAAAPVGAAGPVNRNLELASIAAIALGTGIGQVAVVLFPSLAVQRLGVTAPATGVLMLPLAVAGIAATVAVAATLDRLGAKRLLVAGGFCTVAGVLLAAAAPASSAMFLAGAAVLGVGISALSGGPLRYAAARAVGAAAQGPVQAGVALVTNVGVTGGSLVVGALAARGPDERAALEMAMLLACAAMTLLFAPSMFLRARWDS